MSLAVVFLVIAAFSLVAMSPMLLRMLRNRLDNSGAPALPPGMDLYRIIKVEDHYLAQVRDDFHERWDVIEKGGRDEIHYSYAVDNPTNYYHDTEEEAGLTLNKHYELFQGSHEVIWPRPETLTWNKPDADSGSDLPAVR